MHFAFRVCKWLYVNSLHLNLPTCRYAHWFSNYLWWHAEVVLLRLISVSLLREQLDDVQDYFGGLLDVLERGKLHLAVEVQAAGEDVRAWEAFE